MSKISQRSIEKAVRAARKAGCPPTSLECHPDGKIILCFGGSHPVQEDLLDREMEQWRRNNAAA
jgi:hypothetical protein